MATCRELFPPSEKEPSRAGSGLKRRRKPSLWRSVMSFPGIGKKEFARSTYFLLKWGVSHRFGRVASFFAVRDGSRRKFYVATRRKQCEVFSGDVPRCYRRWAAKTKPRLRNLRSQKTDRDTPKEAIVRMTWRLPRQYALPMPKRNYASRSIPTFRYTGLIRSEYAKP